MDRVLITADGYTRMEIEIKQLKSVERPKVIQDIAEARAHGDLKENAEYHAAKERQGFIEGRLAHLEGLYAAAEVIHPTEISGESITFGATVVLVDEETEEEVTYQIVSEYEADLPRGKISVTAPIARALIGKEAGESVTVKTPKGEKYYEILHLRFV